MEKYFEESSIASSFREGKEAGVLNSSADSEIGSSTLRLPGGLDRRPALEKTRFARK